MPHLYKLYINYLKLFFTGEKFIAKQVDKRKKKKLQNDANKMLGWGTLLKHISRYVKIVVIVLLEQILSYIDISFYYLGGRDDSKAAIPTTIVLRYMFSPAEMRVILSTTVMFYVFYTVHGFT